MSVSENVKISSRLMGSKAVAVAVAGQGAGAGLGEGVGELFG